MSALLAELRTRLRQLQGEVDKDSRRLQELTTAVHTKKRAIQTIEELIRLEGGEDERVGTVMPFPELPDVGTRSPIAEAVSTILREKGEAMHYSDLTLEAQRRGVAIGGKNPANTLLAHLSRDDRFYRPSRGTYGLREWNPGAKSVGAHRKKGA
jgi:hypothetical protein